MSVVNWKNLNHWSRCLEVGQELVVVSLVVAKEMLESPTLVPVVAALK